MFGHSVLSHLFPGRSNRACLPHVTSLQFPNAPGYMPFIVLVYHTLSLGTRFALLGNLHALFKLRRDWGRGITGGSRCGRLGSRFQRDPVAFRRIRVGFCFFKISAWRGQADRGGMTGHAWGLAPTPTGQNSLLTAQSHVSPRRWWPPFPFTRLAVHHSTFCLELS